MNTSNPISSSIQKQESEIKEEVSLKKKKQSVNKLVIWTSLLLLSGTVIGLIRILYQLFSQG